MSKPRIFILSIAILALLLSSGCRRGKGTPEWEKFSPAVQVVLLETSGAERVFCEQLAFGAVKNGLAVEKAHYGFHNLSRRSIELDLDYQSLPDAPERIRIAMSVTCEGKQTDVPQAVWDLRGEMQVAEGEGWSVKLVPHYEEPRGAVSGDKLDWDAMKAEYERTGKPPAELILKKE